jgi:hypothetical protein
MPKWYSKNPQTGWRHKRTTAPPPESVAPHPWRPSPPWTLPVPPGDTEGNESYEIDGMPSRCVYMHSPLPNTQLFNHNAFAKNSKRYEDFIPNLLSTLSAAWKYHWYWFWRRQQLFGWIWGCRRDLSERNRRTTLMYTLKDPFICTINKQYSDNENIREEDRMTVKTPYLIIYTKVNGCIMQIGLWQNERQRSVNDFLSCKSVY